MDSGELVCIVEVPCPSEVEPVRLGNGGSAGLAGWLVEESAGTFFLNLTFFSKSSFAADGCCWMVCGILSARRALVAFPAVPVIAIGISIT